MKETTLCLPVEGSPPVRVLLGLKKSGFGTGKYTGFGGKVEAGETARSAAIRELEEETGIRVQFDDLHPAGFLIFQFPTQPAWSQHVHVFLAARWEGEPAESCEMVPAWFPADSLPLDRMWQDGAHWLPRILAGERILAHFTFGNDNETLERVRIEPWDGPRPPAQEEDARLSVQEILNFLPISDTIGTAGQPTREQFATIRAAGYEVVVNLAMPKSTGALSDEGEVVAALGMEYVHIPVVWENPTLADLARFFEVMAEQEGKRMFLHCALNMRVSAFVLLYRVIHRGVPLDAAWEDLHKIWVPDAVWQQFIDKALACYSVAGGGS